MELRELQEVLACLPKDETPYVYPRDGYALMLLSRYVGAGKSIAEIRRSPYAQLLHKPQVKQALARAGGGFLSRQHLRQPEKGGLEFVLTLNKWGGSDDSAYYQTSRRGYNLVLQLNFSAQQQQEFERLVRPRYSAIFNYRGHPILRRGQRPYFYDTLAWARIDVDFDLNQALIEEVQSDWVRYARYALWARRHRRHKRDGRAWARKMSANVFELAHYVEHELAPYARQWQEAVLTAAIEFIRQELGISVLYYHSADTGAAVKRIDGELPPRSLYSELPRRLCFEPTWQAPHMVARFAEVRRRLRQSGHDQWYRLSL